ncbi:glycosyltransferase [Cohnella sp. GCM10020058]|uniref:glycosyltransferase n=1 Tax=Cohnella sp. GCM10020058 TaxID=3317330 RepID=UPI003629BDA6
MLTSIVIATFNKLAFTQECIDSIRRHTEPGAYELIVVDNRSTDGTQDWLREQEDVRLVQNDDNLGFTAACNQGVAIARGTEILLLNNDTVVTPRWLSNMLACLYSADDVGAVGTVTNYCSNYQSIPVDYADMDGMQAFAADYNRSDPTRWEERLRLIGYNMLIRREALDRVGPLDERFSPGNFEDDDLSLRLRQAGYRLLLCKDTFIHHHGSVSFGEARERFAALLRTNAAKFEDKWDFAPGDATYIRFDVAERIWLPQDAPLNVLEIGAGAGGTLMHIRGSYPGARLFGVEERAGAAASAGLFAAMLQGEATEAYPLLPDGYFDVVFLNRRLDAFPDQAEALRRTLALLKPGGVLLAVVPNLLQPSFLYALLDGTVPRERLAAATLPELYAWLGRAGFEDVWITGIYNDMSDTDRHILLAANSLRGRPAPLHFDMSEYVVRAVRPARCKGAGDDEGNKNDAGSESDAGNESDAGSVGDAGNESDAGSMGDAGNEELEHDSERGHVGGNKSELVGTGAGGGNGSDRKNRARTALFDRMGAGVMPVSELVARLRDIRVAGAPGCSNEFNACSKRGTPMCTCGGVASRSR